MTSVFEVVNASSASVTGAPCMASRTTRANSVRLESLGLTMTAGGSLGSGQAEMLSSEPSTNERPVLSHSCTAAASPRRRRAVNPVLLPERLDHDAVRRRGYVGSCLQRLGRLHGAGRDGANTVCAVRSEEH